MFQAQKERDPSLEGRIRSLIPTNRLGLPADVAAMAIFLSGESSGFINGVTIDVNGGWVMV